jgi:hypothetical protein
MKFEFSREIFEKVSISSFIKIRPVEAESLFAVLRTRIITVEINKLNIYECYVISTSEEACRISYWNFKSVLISSASFFWQQNILSCNWIIFTASHFLLNSMNKHLSTHAEIKTCAVCTKIMHHPQEEARRRRSIPGGKQSNASGTILAWAVYWTLFNTRKWPNTCLLNTRKWPNTCLLATYVSGQTPVFWTST